MGLGLLQTLIARPPATKTSFFRRPNLHPPAHPILFHGHSSIPVVPVDRTFPSISPIIRASNGSSNQVQGHGNQDFRDSREKKVLSWGQTLLDFVNSNFLPLALVSGVVIGLANPSLGCLAHEYGLSKVSTSGIFLISGLMLRSGEIGAAIKAWPAAIFGIASILFFSPLFSKLIVKVQLAPQEFVTGIAIFCCMPTTLSSGVALTQLVGGNSALALAMTVISNLLGILIVPFSLSRLIAGVGVAIPTKQLFKSLVSTLLVPLLLGKVLRESSFRVAEIVDRNRQLLSMISAIFLSLVPWTQVSRSRSLLLMVKPAMFLLAIGLGLLLHIILLGMNAFAVQSLSSISGNEKSVFSKKENTRALIIVASQKTLPVAVAIVEPLGGALGESGLLILPCVAAHINQIIIDSFLVNFWIHKDQSKPKDT